MNKSLIRIYLPVTFLIVSLFSCRKEGLHSATAKQIQYRWEQISQSSRTDYFDGRDLSWTVISSQSGHYTEFDKNGNLYSTFGSFTVNYLYKVDGDKILSLAAASSRPTTPQYTDTAMIKKVDDHLLVLYRRKYFISGAYSYLNEYLDSLKR